MNTQNKTIKEILSLYNVILENKNVNEASDVYDNVDFKNIGHGNPSSDTINISLLQDVETAAKKAGLKVDITTAVSGHDKGTRHEKGNAVDIAQINGKPVSLSNRADADKLVAALVSMGYTKNKEDSSTPKSVLTFGFKNHNDHVHVSNIYNKPSDQNSPETTSSSSVSDDDDESGRDPLISMWGGALIDFLKSSGGKKLGENIHRIKNLL
jgi:hypothetical protein